MKHSLDVLSGSQDGNKLWALISLALTSWGNYVGAKALLSIPVVLNLARQLATAENKLIFLQQYASQVLGRPVSVQFWSESGGRFADDVISLPANASNWQLASVFLHELTHAQQLAAGGMLDGLRRASAWIMPPELHNPQGIWNKIQAIARSFPYALNPAEHLAAASGGGSPPGNFLGVIIPWILGEYETIWVLFNPDSANHEEESAP